MSPILRTEFLWSNKEELQAKYDQLNLPIPEDEVYKEWRKICFNIASIIKIEPVIVIHGSEELTVCEILTRHNESAYILNIEYDHIVEAWSLFLCGESSTEIKLAIE